MFLLTLGIQSKLNLLDIFDFCQNFKTTIPIQINLFRSGIIISSHYDVVAMFVTQISIPLQQKMF